MEGTCFINALQTLDLAHTINDCLKQCLKEHFILLLINLSGVACKATTLWRSCSLYTKVAPHVNRCEFTLLFKGRCWWWLPVIDATEQWALLYDRHSLLSMNYVLTINRWVLLLAIITRMLGVLGHFTAKEWMLWHASLVVLHEIYLIHHHAFFLPIVSIKSGEVVDPILQLSVLMRHIFIIFHVWELLILVWLVVLRSIVAEFLLLLSQAKLVSVFIHWGGHEVRFLLQANILSLPQHMNSQLRWNLFMVYVAIVGSTKMLELIVLGSLLA